MGTGGVCARAVVAALFWSTLSGSALATDRLAGLWTGRGEDTRGDRFDIVVSLFADGSAAIAYDGVFQGERYACGGLLLPIGPAPNEGRAFREAIAAGACIDGATVVLTPALDLAAPDNLRLSFAWESEAEGGVTAHGALIRTRTGKPPTS